MDDKAQRLKEVCSFLNEKLNNYLTSMLRTVRYSRTCPLYKNFEPQAIAQFVW